MVKWWIVALILVSLFLFANVARQVIIILNIRSYTFPRGFYNLTSCLSDNFGLQVPLHFLYITDKVKTLWLSMHPAIDMTDQKLWFDIFSAVEKGED